MPTTARRNNFSGGIPMYQYVIQPSAAVPVSPTSMSYKMLLENLPHQLHPKKNKKQSQEEGEEDVERRMSVRASECAFKYKEIIIKKCHKYTQIWLYTHTKMKNALNPQVIIPSENHPYNFIIPRRSRRDIVLAASVRPSIPSVRAADMDLGAFLVI